MVIWFTGLSGSGKSTICKRLYERLKPVIPELILLDGDSVRAAFGDDLGYTEADRHRQIHRLQGLARLLSDQGLVVIVAAVYANPELMSWNRQHLRGYFEVLVDAPLELVQSRDAKGLYARAARGEAHHVVGVDITWQPPAAPDLVIPAARLEPPDLLAQRVIDAIPRLAVHAQQT